MSAYLTVYMSAAQQESQSDWKKALLVSAYQFAQRLVPGREHLGTKPAREFLLL